VTVRRGSLERANDLLRLKKGAEFRSLGSDNLDLLVAAMVSCTAEIGQYRTSKPLPQPMQSMKHSVHADGSPCVAGTQTIPKNYQPCCKRFAQGTLNCEFDIRFEWWATNNTWVVRLPDGGSSGMDISFCPYCGTKLPE